MEVVPGEPDANRLPAALQLGEKVESYGVKRRRPGVRPAFRLHEQESYLASLNLGFLSDRMGLMVFDLHHCEKSVFGKSGCDEPGDKGVLLKRGGLSHRTPPGMARTSHFENILSDSSVSDQTKILVVNAAYFVGKWMKKFPESETKECPFRVNKTDTKPVQMMSLEATFCLGHIDSIGCKIIELPFQNKHLSMLILLPKDVDDDTTGLEKVEKQLNSETLLQWTNPSTMANAKVKLSIPKFKVEKVIDPKASLENLGLKNVFNEDTSDFSGMSETKGVALSNVIHRVCLEITEDGGESIEVPGSRILQHKDEFTADHPFIYIIRHNKTRNIIFFGKFCSP
ncbi:Serpin B5 [Pteropus alecto]|uniref:Serpin B5 n=1 Tax=Pteropus alecto TaxID=9402 RepID=L5KHP7_PTEAL|nr:Serpin B5 [Pteropus alecto]